MNAAQLLASPWAPIQPPFIQQACLGRAHSPSDEDVLCCADTGEHYHQSARQATEQRRDYGAAPQGPAMSKSAERAMAERDIHSTTHPGPTSSAQPQGRPHQAPMQPPIQGLARSSSAQHFGHTVSGAQRTAVPLAHAHASQSFGPGVVSIVKAEPVQGSSAPTLFPGMAISQRAQPLNGIHQQGAASGPGGPDGDMENLLGDGQDAGDEDMLWDDLRGLEAGPSAIRFAKKPQAAAATAAAAAASVAVPLQRLASGAAFARMPSHGRNVMLPVKQQESQLSAEGPQAAPLGAKSQADGIRNAPTAGSVPAAVPAARKKSGLLDVGGRQRVIIHCDVDCFYCQLERLDDASLQGVPLAVQQFNSGGFVAVSYEVWSCCICAPAVTDIMGPKQLACRLSGVPFEACMPLE